MAEQQGMRRRRGRLAEARSERGTPRFSRAEWAQVTAAAAARGLAVNAWLAEAAMRAARAECTPLPADWRQVLAELIQARAEVRRVGRLLEHTTQVDCRADTSATGGGGPGHGAAGSHRAGQADAAGAAAAAMIGRVYRGGDSRGLLRYLYGPGHSNDHSDQHLVASWDGDPAGLEPAVGRGAGAGWAGWPSCWRRRWICSSGTRAGSSGTARCGPLQATGG